MIEKPVPEVPEVLVHWRYTPDEWRAFTELEGKSTRFDITDTHLKFIGAVAAILVAGAALKAEGAAAIFFMLLGCGLILGLFLLSPILKKARKDRLEGSPGDVWVTPEGICVNGGWSCWGSRDGKSNLQSVRRVLAEDRAELSITPGPRIEILRFNVLYVNKIRGVTHHTREEWRVPVPAGHEAEADRVVRWFAEQLFEGERLGSDAGSIGGSTPGDWPHDFVGATCRKCGMSVAAATQFKWGCRER